MVKKSTKFFPQQVWLLQDSDGNEAPAVRTLSWYLTRLQVLYHLSCELFVIIFGVEVEVYYSSIKHHKLKRRVELKERKILEILKNHFGHSIN